MISSYAGKRESQSEQLVKMGSVRSKQKETFHSSPHFSNFAYSSEA